MDNNKKEELARPLTQQERDYVLHHLAQFIETDAPLSDLITMPQNDTKIQKHFSIDGIPILFPSSDATLPYEERDGHIIFLHDLIKSAFYLLSAYQEWAIADRDKWGRFPYDKSLQKELGIERIPVVNYYFKWLVEGIEKECVIRNIKYERKSPMGSARICLTHDIDQTHYLTLHKALFRVAQVIGLRPCDTSRKRLAKAALRSLLHAAHIIKLPDTYWSYDTIQDNEAFLGYRSHWFFLTKDKGPFPPDYDLSKDEDIRALMRTLHERGNIIGAHAPINCQKSDDYNALLKTIKEASGTDITTCRQHFLAIEPRTSLRAMQEAGIKEDYTIGFSEHEGFRTSYCLPYHPFDHDRQQMMQITEFPLAMMDVTVLRHRNLSYDDIFLATGEMLDEVRKFDGVFSILWHNSTFDEVYYPGINKFYEDLMLMISQYQLTWI